MDVSTLSPASRRTMSAMHTSDGWMTYSEMAEGVSAMALTLMAIRADPWIQRRRTEWGGEPGQKRGSGYEYRMTPRGREVRAALNAVAAHGKTPSMTSDGLEGLRAMIAPATRAVEVASLPPVRRRMCARCPYGDGLNRVEQVQADALKTQLASQPHRLWGCHETIDGKPQICAGFAATRPDAFPAVDQA